MCAVTNRDQFYSIKCQGLTYILVMLWTHQVSDSPASIKYRRIQVQTPKYRSGHLQFFTIHLCMIEILHACVIHECFYQKIKHVTMRGQKKSNQSSHAVMQPTTRGVYSDHTQAYYFPIKKSTFSSVVFHSNSCLSNHLQLCIHGKDRRNHDL